MTTGGVRFGRQSSLWWSTSSVKPASSGPSPEWRKASRWPARPWIRPEVAALRWQEAAVTASLRAAHNGMEAGDLRASLDASTRAADGLVGLRRGLLDMYRVRALPELYLQARQILTDTGGGPNPTAAVVLAEHSRLAEAARLAVAGADRERAHAALAAVRGSQLRITIEALGPALAAPVVDDVAAALRELQPGEDRAPPRLRRMLRAATDLHHRARTALAAGDAVAALDLGSYAAGLVNAYRLANVRF